LAKPPAGHVLNSQNAAGYFLSHRVDDAFSGTTRLLAAGEDVYWLKTDFTANGKTYPAGTIYIPAKPSTAAQVEKLSKELNLTFEGTAAKPQGAALKLRPVRVGLWDRYGGSQDSGHIVYAPALDAGNLKSKYDVLIFPDGALPGGEGGGRGGRGGGGRGGPGGPAGGPAGATGTAAGGDAPLAGAPGGRGGGRGGRGGGRAGDVPDEYKNEIGNITAATTGPQLHSFVEDGGTVLAIGSSTGFDHYFGLPLSNALTDASGVRLPNTKFYIPGSVLQASVDNSLPIAYGMQKAADVFYINSPAFHLLPGAAEKGTRPIAWFPNPEPLRSGWAWGQQYLNGAVGAVEGDVGKGKVYLFGPEITFRGQPYGTFKFLFNAIYLAGATPATLP
jgi:hypothetical protein